MVSFIHIQEVNKPGFYINPNHITMIGVSNYNERMFVISTSTTSHTFISPFENVKQLIAYITEAAS